MKIFLRLFFLCILIALLQVVTAFSQAVTYRVCIKTGDIKDAGTDANISITLKGEYEDSTPIPLSTSKDHSNKFEQNHMDSFDCPTRDIGPIKSIVILSDMSGDKAGWFLDSVVVFYPPQGKADPRYPNPINISLPFPMGSSSGNQNQNVTTFKYGNWIETTAPVTLEMIDRIGGVNGPNRTNISRSIFNSAQVDVDQNFGTGVLTIPKLWTYSTSDTVQYSKTEGILTETEFAANFSGNAIFVSQSMSLRTKIEKTTTEYYSSSNTITRTDSGGVNITLNPSEICATYVQRYDVQTMGTIAYQDYGTNVIHNYTVSFPSTPGVDYSIHNFKGIKKNEGGQNVWYLEPTDPNAMINQTVIDKLKSLGYKFVNEPSLKIERQLIKGIFIKKKVVPGKIIIKR